MEQAAAKRAKVLRYLESLDGETMWVGFDYEGETLYARQAGVRFMDLPGDIQELFDDDPPTTAEVIMAFESIGTEKQMSKTPPITPAALIGLRWPHESSGKEAYEAAIITDGRLHTYWTSQIKQFDGSDLKRLFEIVKEQEASG